MTIYSTAGKPGTYPDAFPHTTRLAVISTVSGPVCTLSLRGWLDAESVVALETQFDQLDSQRFGTIVVDVRGLCGLDDAGSAALDYIRDQARRRGSEVRVVGSGAGWSIADRARTIDIREHRQRRTA